MKNSNTHNTKITMAQVKTCTCCGETKTLDNFTKVTKNKDGYDYRCKACKKIAKRANYYENVLDEYVVYILPNLNAYGYEAYAGVTNNPQNRIPDHKYKGNNTEGWFIVGTFADVHTAKQVERQFHENGYAGAWQWKVRDRFNEN